MLTTLYVKTASFMTSFKNDERGVTAIEYGLIAVAMASVLGIIFASGDGTLIEALKAAFKTVEDKLKTP
ncbi:Flp family type IVb pilin [Vibrio nomapromontoriensis]|uniref:Flp family type IVb pilin n=1 Tax=Vibrio nomapromontoriensis TaxID=2910246 RepID=UPI003D0D28C8